LVTKNSQEEELRKLSVELRLLEQTAQTLQQRISVMNAALTDLTYANMTLDGIKKEKENAALLVPIGGSSYIKVRLANVDKVIVGMGAGVSIEKTLPEAKTIVNQRLTDLQKNMNSAQQQFSQIIERLNSGRKRLESMLSSAQEGTK
jgi:prefoldin alpha subunit